MSVIKKIVLIAAAIAVAYFAPQLSVFIAQALSVSAFVATVIGAIVIAVGFSLLQGILLGGGRRSRSSDDAKYNVRLTEPIRWIAAGGETRLGGGVLFAEYDNSGNFWYLLVHGDSILNSAVKYYLDDQLITLDGSGNVITNDFCLNDKKEPYTGTGTRVPYFQIFTTTYTLANPTPPGIAAFKAANPQWTDDHKLVGTTYSVIRVAAIDVENRYKVMRWRGPIGLGEPSFSIVGSWSLPYDPRTGLYAPTRNTALIWAWFRTHPFGRNKPSSSISWDRVAEQANICDQIVTSAFGSGVGALFTQKRYQCDIAIPEDKERWQAEQEIIITCDGQLMFDDDGKCWLRVGYYYVPTLALSRNRDIVAMESVEAQNGESETQGVIVRYTDPDANYAVQPSAVWTNPLYYQPAQGNTYLTIDILGCQNHNQAMRLAKSIGMRSQPAHKIAPIVGLRGLLARGERIFNLLYDNTFAGDYEIATPVELDEQGMFCNFGAVPISSDRFDLLPGEEKPKPNAADAEIVQTFANANVTSIAYTNGRIEAKFTAPARPDVYYQFQDIPTADIASDEWIDMAVQMAQLIAVSGPVANGAYKVRYRALSTSGVPTAWSANVDVSVSQSIDAPTLLTLVGTTATTATISARAPSSANFQSLQFWRGPTDLFSDASVLGSPVIVGLGAVAEITDTTTAGTYRYFVTAISTGGGSSASVGPLVVTI
jgi:hypothetical protein